MFSTEYPLSAISVKRHIYNNYKISFLQDITTVKSLNHYSIVKMDTFTPSYIRSKFVPFNWIRLKFKIRTGVSGLGQDLHRQHRGNGYCAFCGEFESVKHFIFKCALYTIPRQRMFNEIKASYDDETFSIFLSESDFALYSLIGDQDNAFNYHFLNFLSSAWPMRETCL